MRTVRRMMVAGLLAVTLPTVALAGPIDPVNDPLQQVEDERDQASFFAILVEALTLLDQRVRRYRIL